MRQRWRSRRSGLGAQPLAILAVLGFLAAGCGGDDGGDGDGSGGGDGGNEQDADENAEATPEEPPTIDELLALDRPLNIAHAGGDAEWPHSTLFAYGQAVEAGADMLELDVRLSRDGVVVVHHDDTVDRITEAQGPVADLTVAELQELDAAYWFTPAEWDGRSAGEQAEHPYRGIRTGEVEPPEGYGPEDFTIPTLQDVVERFPQMPLDIEIKGAGEQGAAVAEALAQELEGLDRLESAVVVSFDQATVDAFHQLAPEVDISPGTDDMVSWYIGEGDLDPYRILQLPPSFEEVEVFTEENLERIHSEDHDMYTWVFMNGYEEETTESYQRFIDLGVDGIITARPSQFPES